MQIYHPEKFPDREDEAVNTIKIIKTSYDVLINPETRAEYDRYLKKQRRDRVQAAYKVLKLTEEAANSQKPRPRSTPFLVSESVTTIKDSDSLEIEFPSNAGRKRKLNYIIYTGIAGVMLVIVYYSLINGPLIQQITFWSWFAGEK
jgi:curved DNA-binding protein CbpA